MGVERTWSVRASLERARGVGASLERARPRLSSSLLAATHHRPDHDPASP